MTVRGEGVTVQFLSAATAAFRFGRVLAEISSSVLRLDTRLARWNSDAAGGRSAGDDSGEGAALLAAATD